MVLTNAISQNKMLTLITLIPEEDLKVYGTVIYWAACRAGEILPYQHYKIIYKKDENGRLQRDERGNPIVQEKIKAKTTYGINIENIIIEDERIHIKEIPVFKTRGETYKEAIIWKRNNPLFDNTVRYINKRLEFKKQLQEKGNHRAVFLFEAEIDESLERYMWRFTKRFYLALKKLDPTLKIHSLRVSRATEAGNASGDAFYVRDITGHKSIQMAAEYTKSRNFLEKATKYEGESD